MYQVQQITSAPLQNLVMTLPDGTKIYMTIYYVQRQVGWFITSFTYGSFTLQGIRITNSFNILRQWINELPFGLACFSAGTREPTNINDFSQAYSNLYILTDAEVLEYESYLSNSTLYLFPFDSTVIEGNTLQFSASGGVAPYAFIVSTNNSGASITSAGLYTAGTTAGVIDTVEAIDSVGNTAFVPVNVS